ncbi:MAG: polysaccharide biosynthesis/export family protein [Bryobacteraceae bacterium]|nr:polysaccharide biosynthesis/export family protein [Bryobacteraceae bacterium]
MKLLLVLVLSALAWAQQQPSGSTPPEPAKPKDSLPLPDKELAELAKVPSAPVDPKSYKIGPEDILLIRVWREPELTGPVAVRPDGNITLPLVGDIQAGNLTPDELTKAVVEKLSTLINTPQVMVSVQAVRSKKYYVSGEVNRPGLYPLVTATTVLEALSQAGGFREFADQKNVLIVRGVERLKFNYKDVVKGKKLEQNVALQNGDHIIVQ